LLLLGLASDGRAQYFGRNKVQYDREDVRILATEHFDIYYSSQDAAAAQIAGRLSERWYGRLSAVLDHTLSGRQPVVVYGSHRRFEQTNVHSGFIDESMGGFTDSRKRRIVLPFAASLAETDHVLGHEIVHAFQRDILRRQGRSLSMLPLWFSEGMAEQLSVGALDANTRMWLRDAERSHRVPTLAQLDNPKYFPYRYGQALWSWLGSRYGSEVAARALRARSGSAIGRLQQATGARKEELEAGWREFVAEVAGHASSAEPATTLRRLIGGGPDDGQLNVGPALSPDGRFLVFLSERDQHAVDVYLADAKSGRVRRRLLSTATDPHFDALQFIESAGAWDLQSRSFVLATVGDGHSITPSS
jgi:hypothetical protein